jgi:hypothetical protein
VQRHCILRRPGRGMPGGPYVLQHYQGGEQFASAPSRG